MCTKAASQGQQHAVSDSAPNCLQCECEQIQVDIVTIVKPGKILRQSACLMTPAGPLSVHLHTHLVQLAT